jgi:VWFA-related protein
MTACHWKSWLMKQQIKSVIMTGSLILIVSITTVVPLQAQSIDSGAQSKKAPGKAAANEASERRPIFQSDVREVTVVFRAIDKDNQPVSGITAGDIQIEDDGVSRKITSFEGNVAHAQVVILADVSGSMSTVLEPLKGALFTFAGMVSKDLDREAGDVLLSLVPFSQTATMLIDRTPNPEEFREAVTRLRPSGTTALVDTVLATLVNAFGSKEISGARKPAVPPEQDTSPIPSRYRSKRSLAGIEGAKRSKFLVIFTDAGENASSHHWSDIASAMLGKDIVIYSVEFDSGSPDSNFRMLSRIALQSGGKVLRASSADLERVYAEIARDIRSHYLLTFSASDIGNPHRWRNIRLSTSRPETTLFARAGYCPQTPCQKADGSFVGGQPKNWNEVLEISRDPGVISSVRQSLQGLKFEYTAETMRIVRDLATNPLLIEKVWVSEGKRSGQTDRPSFIAHMANKGHQFVNIDAEVCGITVDNETSSLGQPNVAGNPPLKFSSEPVLRVVNPEIRLARRPGSAQPDGAAQDAYFQSQAIFYLKDPSGRIASRIRVQCNRPHFLLGEDLVQFAVRALEHGLKVKSQGTHQDDVL